MEIGAGSSMFQLGFSGNRSSCIPYNWSIIIFLHSSHSSCHFGGTTQPEVCPRKLPAPAALRIGDRTLEKNWEKLRELPWTTILDIFWRHLVVGCTQSWWWLTLGIAVLSIMASFWRVKCLIRVNLVAALDSWYKISWCSFVFPLQEQQFLPRGCFYVGSVLYNGIYTRARASLKTRDIIYSVQVGLFQKFKTKGTVHENVLITYRFLSP